MSLPKRLFHVPSMSTVFYKDNADDVKNKGYVAISHVWGDQEMFTASELDIKNGVNWRIPLSHHKKLRMVIKAMLYFKKEYCWFDVLCMPQDKQDEINREIPFMGDYYSGADMTLVLSSTKEIIFTPIDTYLFNKITMRKKVGYFWTQTTVMSINVFKDEWFNRVWTYQEAVLSKNMIYVSASNMYLKLSEALDTLINKRAKEPVIMVSDEDKTDSMVKLGDGIRIYRENRMDLMSALSRSMKRSCKNPQDQFYGILGILGYTTFPVDYNMDKYRLSKEIAKYAYSKGDISWLAVGKNPSVGFIQLADTPFGHIGVNWKEDTPGICAIYKEGTLEITACMIGVITRSIRWREDECKDKIIFWIRNFKEWGFSMNTAKEAIVVDREVPNDVLESFMYLNTHGYVHDIPSGRFWATTRNYARLNEVAKLEHMLNKEEHTSPEQSIAIITHHKTNKQQPVIVSGCVDVGDKVMLLRIRDGYGRVLGIIVDENHRRKGIFLHTKANMEEELVYIPCKFPL